MGKSLPGPKTLPFHGVKGRDFSNPEIFFRNGVPGDEETCAAQKKIYLKEGREQGEKVAILVGMGSATKGSWGQSSANSGGELSVL